VTWLVINDRIAAPIIATAADMTGAGATFPYPIYAKWAEMYKKPPPATA
jgi:ABC-type phosphate transport system substrate-binding protein